ncbi:MAG: SRPBCC domain-containing protein, partial [Saprospiraceae bacterium]|nr:SRPBCC domain-containing protein [Saprospiraceae bacterium]
QKIAYTLGDGRKAEVHFSSQGDETKVIVTFEAETENSVELQQGGWQAILNNFKAHVESQEG